MRKPWRCGFLAVLAIATSATVLPAQTLDGGMAQIRSDPDQRRPESSTPDTVEENRRKEAEEAARLRELFLRQEKVFISRGELLVEFGTIYTTDTSSDLVSSSGELISARRRARFVDTSVVVRYGLWDGLEADLRVPFVHAEQELDFGSSRTREEDTGIGDVSGSLRYQLTGERGAWPAVVLDVGAKSRTAGDTIRGSGHWSAGGGVTAVKTIDPVAIFGRVGYTATIERDDRDPGDIIEYRLGMGYSLNDRVSVSMQLAGAVVGRFERGGRDVQGSSREIMTLIFATTVLATKRLFVEPTVGVGLTDDTADAFVGLRFPYRF